MKIKALVTTFVLGTSSLAVAAPTVRDHRAPQVLPKPVPAKPLPAPPQARPAPAPGFGFGWQARPVLLANNKHISGRTVIQVPTSARMFTKLELRANSGQTNIQRVLIVFGNGQRQVVQLRKTVNNRTPLTIDLAGNARHIKSVTLIGNSPRRASIDVLAV